VSEYVDVCIYVCVHECVCVYVSEWSWCCSFPAAAARSPHICVYLNIYVCIGMLVCVGEGWTNMVWVGEWVTNSLVCVGDFLRTPRMYTYVCV